MTTAVQDARPTASPRLRLLLALLATVGLAACARPAADGSAARAQAYPTLASVPPRPQLSYSVAQRRAIETSLVRDREHAAYLGSVLDYDLGVTASPPPAPPAPAAEPTAGQPAPPRAKTEPRQGPGDNPLVEAYVDEAMQRGEDRGKLKDFIKRLERPTPSSAPRTSLSSVVGLTDAAADAPPASPALDQFGSYLGGSLGVEPEAPVASAPAEAVVARVAFAPGSSELAAGARAELARALDAARARNLGLRIAAGGDDPGLRAERGGEVATALVRLGASADMLELAPGAGGEEAVISLRDQAPS